MSSAPRSESATPRYLPERRCACGEMFVEMTYSGDRAILNVQTDELVAPLNLRCLMGHRQEVWIEPEEAETYLRSVGVVA